MKRVVKLVAIGLLSCMLLSGCGKDKIINRTNVYGAYDLEYQYFNSEDTCQFELEDGQQLNFSVQTQKGSVEIKVVDLDDKELFCEDILVSKTFEIVPEKAGRYIVILTGHKAEGKIDITVDSQTSK